MKKKIMAMVLAMIMVVGASACGSSTDSAEDVKDSTEGTEASSSSEDSAGTTITVYTNSGSDGRGDWLIERAKEDGFSLQLIQADGIDIHNRLVAEKESPIADVIFGLNSISWEVLKNADVLTPYCPEWADEVVEGLNDSEDYYHATVRQGIFLVYDANQVDEAEAPTDWLDLWTKDEFKGTYEYKTSLTGSTNQVVLSSILTRYADPDGDLGISEEGWEQIAQYYQNGVPSEEGVDVYALIGDHENPVQFGQIWSSGIAARDEQYGTDTRYVVPEIGIPFTAESVGLVKGAKNEEEAKRFIDWFGSAQIQGEWAEEFSTLPANENAVEKANEFNQEIAKLPVQDVDCALAAEYMDAWCEKMELEYIP